LNFFMDASTNFFADGMESCSSQYQLIEP
jgi:hypothetical protein